MSTAPQLLLTGFADEAANDKTIDQQFSAFAALGLKYFSIRFVDAGSGVKNVMQLDDEELGFVTGKMAEYGLQVSSLGSPLGKVKLLDVDDGRQTVSLLSRSIWKTKSGEHVIWRTGLVRS